MQPFCPPQQDRVENVTPPNSWEEPRCHLKGEALEMSAMSANQGLGIIPFNLVSN